MIKRFLIGIVLLAGIVASCERDDICARSTPTTPLVVIQFFDIENISSAKTINLKIAEVGNEDTLSFSNDTLIRLPLRTNVDETTFNFIKNPGGAADSQNPENSDIVTFTYNTNELFISRACGFRVSYDNLNLTKLNGADGRWIENFDINSNIIVDEDTTHVFIYH